MTLLSRPKSPTIEERYPNKSHLKGFKGCVDLPLDVSPKTETACTVFNSVKELFNINACELKELKSTVTSALLPNDPRYEEYRMGYNKRFNFYPAIIVLVWIVDDIIETIKFCREKGLPFVVRSGGHGYEPSSVLQFGCVIDLVNFDKTTIKHNKAIVQVGSTLGQALEVINSAGFVLPTGTCITNGVGGYSLGGGVGFYTKKLGPTVESIVEVKLVNYKGKLITTNKCENSDLFFALRGAGGGNFGIVTEITYQLHTFEKTIVFDFRYKFEEENIINLCYFWQKWMDETDDNLNVDITINAPHIPVSVSGIYFGTEEDFLKIIRPLHKFKPIHFEFNEAESPKDVSEYFGRGSFARPFYQMTKHKIAEELKDRELFATIVTQARKIPSEDPFTKINFTWLNFESDSKIAYPYNKAKFWVFFSAVWGIPSKKEEERNAAWVHGIVAATNPFFTAPYAQYINFLNYDLPRKSYLESYFRCNVDKLKEIKRKYDPHNVFSFKQGIEPKYEELQ